MSRLAGLPPVVAVLQVLNAAGMQPPLLPVLQILPLGCVNRCLSFYKYGTPLGRDRRHILD